ncbi:GTP cyclohydrolase II [Cyanidiococcus yangmingshanensis]|uniref:3,4-dihydroxy-2-butanone-4-phosphate synthase n=1 Tax=Cyanidiococcus yangmingshanensis TaxID=2690220 RepID=A0A7J7IL11_9RHOD|nr:GTP cyclohydrolase II [Cyanidiococcus yangmingshanensis]
MFLRVPDSGLLCVSGDRSRRAGNQYFSGRRSFVSPIARQRSCSFMRGAPFLDPKEKAAERSPGHVGSTGHDTASSTRSSGAFSRHVVCITGDANEKESTRHEVTNENGRPSERSSPAEEKEGGWCFGEQSVLAAIAALQRGEFVLVTDDEDRENEGDLIIAAEKVTPQAIAFMVRHTSGVICVSMEEERLEELRLFQMVPDNEDPRRTSFTVSVDLKHGTSTGISAADRSATIRALADPKSTAADFRRPGHIFPLRYAKGGVLKRAGHTEASLDLCRIAGLAPVGVLCEVVNDIDGSMARLPALEAFAQQHNLVLTSIADLVCFRRRTREARTPNRATGCSYADQVWRVYGLRLCERAGWL